MSVTRAVTRLVGVVLSIAMAVGTLASVVPASPRIATADATGSEPILRYYALGDSIASGHGLGDDGTPCHRSALSYPFTVATNLDPYFDVRFPQSTNFLACSGATTTAVNAEDPAKSFEYQVNSAILQIRSHPDDLHLVSVTIGIDNLDWLSQGLLNVLIDPNFAFYP
jgi:hypothetical protein